MALALGTAGTPTLLSGTAYYNTYSPADSISGTFATLAMVKKATTKTVWEIPTAVIHGFTVSAEVGDLAQITFNEMGNKIENESPTNTNLDSVTYPDKHNQAKIDTSFKCRMNKIKPRTFYLKAVVSYIINPVDPDASFNIADLPSRYYTEPGSFLPGERNQYLFYFFIENSPFRP